MKPLLKRPLLLSLLWTVPVFAQGEDILAHGQQLYEAYCTQCHGISGTGNGLNQPALTVQPRNHKDTAEMSARSDEELFKAIKHGGKSINKSILMPAWKGNLTDDDIHALVLYLRQLCCQQTGS